MGDTAYLQDSVSSGQHLEADPGVAVVEIPVEGERWVRYVRTDERRDDGAVIYLRRGERKGPRAECSTCVEPWDLYVSRLGILEARNVGAHSELLRCPTCLRLYEAVPEGRRTPEHLTAQEAVRRFPGWPG